ncbi:MAG TPA: amidohydrolase family protein [Ramlibacter sp.]|nr:amidohydrolase family protein [Ramlibacter sp.]
MDDLVIRNARIVDGTGQASFNGDVAISSGRLTQVGGKAGAGRREIDADGQVVSPGFIDGHTHMDAQINWDSPGSPSCWHGVTSVVMGNCGFTLAPCHRDARALVVRNLERAEDIAAEAMAQGIEWSWETFPEYLDAVDRLPKGINYAANVGHSALRTWAMGEAAFERPANEAELQKMELQLADALRAGAIGFTTSLSAHHETSDDRPVASRLAGWDEVQRLVKGMKRAGGGVFELAKEPATNSGDPRQRRLPLERMKQLAVESGIPMTFGLYATGPTREVWRDQLALLDETAAGGGVMAGQSHSRGISVLLSFKTSLPFDKLPVWRELRALPQEEQKRRLGDRELRARLVQEAQHGDYGRAIGAEARKPDWDRITILERPLPPNPTLAELAEARRVDPVEVMIQAALDSDFECFFMQIVDSSDEAATLEILRHPRTIMTFSDAGAHVSQILDASIQTHLLAYWVRQRREFTLEQAVEMITARAARFWGFADRGVLRPGAVADLNLFDADRITPGMPTLVSDLPGGARRLMQRTEGIQATVVGGELTIWNGEHTGAFPGRLLRRGPQAQ